MTTELILVIFGSTGFWGIIQLLINRRLSKRDEYEQIKDALLAVLHDRLYQGCKYFIHIDSITASALKNLEYLHNAYAEFGGNSTGPGTNYNHKGFIKPGVYTIVETKGSWGRLKSGAGWIHLGYTERV